MSTNPLTRSKSMRRTARLPASARRTSTASSAQSIPWTCSRRHCSGSAEDAENTENSTLRRRNAFASCVLGSKRLDGFHHRVGVSVHLDVIPSLSDPALLVDEKGRPRDAHVLAAVARLLLPHAELLGNGMVGVGQQGKVHGVLLCELRLALFVENADAEDGRLPLFQ